MGTQPPSNPFTQQGMIRDPGQFFGRRAELDQICDRLKTMQSVSVVGERRIGKSSLLYHVGQTAGQRLGGDYQVFYTDLPDVQNEPGFYGRVCQELGAEGSSFGDLERAVRGRKVVACLDEFEKVVGPPGFSRGFFDSLRSLAQSGNFALFVATQHSLADLCRVGQIATSPFWNIFARVDLGLFTREEAEEFVRARFGAAEVPVSEEEVAHILQLAGRFPFFLQGACYHLWEMKVGRAAQWETEFEQKAYDHLLYLWEHRTPPEREALRWVLGLGGRFPHERLLWDLERRGLLVRDRRRPLGFRVFSVAFEGFVRNPPKQPVKIPWQRIGQGIVRGIDKLLEWWGKLRGKKE